MRLVRLLLVVFLASAMQWGWAQTQPEEPTARIYPEFDLAKSVTIFPNPATEYVNIKVAEFTVDKVTVTLHNILGNRMDIETEVVNEHELRVKVKDLASGYYLIAVKEEETKFRGTFKFVKR
jgi:hypothetical protein